MKTKLILVAMMAVAPGKSGAQNDEPPQIHSSTSSGAGGIITGGGYTVTHALGEPLVGDATGGSHSLAAGFWTLRLRDDQVVNLALSLSPQPLLLTENIVRTFTLNVRNNGTADATNLQVVLNLPAGVRFQSAVSSAGPCQVTPGSVTCSVAGLAGQGSFTVALGLRANFLPPSSGLSEIPGNLTAGITAAEADFNSADNSITLPVTVQVQLDGGDAPGGFPVTLEEDGAHHRYSPNGPWLGARWDNDYHGNHSLAADWDDSHGGSDDEDGVQFPATLVPGTEATIVVTATAAGFLEAWGDFNHDRDWADAGEQLFASQPLAPGANTLTFIVPVTAAEGSVCTRWRASATGGLNFTGYGGRGEVEDYVVAVSPGVELAAWRQTWFGTMSNSDHAAGTADPDGDGLTNLVEFAFGTNPVNGSGTVAVTGGVITPGMPAFSVMQTSAGPERRATYCRRKGYAAAGLGYTVQFSSDLTTWIDDTAVPTVIADDGVTEVMTVPLPSAPSGRAAQFFRVTVNGP